MWDAYSERVCVEHQPSGPAANRAVEKQADGAAAVGVIRWGRRGR